MPPTEASSRALNIDADAGPAEGLRLLFALPFGLRLDSPHGGRVTAQLLLHLAKRHRIAVIYLNRHGVPAIDSQIERVCDTIECVPLLSTDSARFRLEHRLAVLASPITRFPSPAAVVKSRTFVDQCARLARDWNPDLIQVEHDELAYVGLALRDRQITTPAVLTCHEPGVQAAGDQARTTSGRQRLAHRLDERAWRRYWTRALPSFDAVVALTTEDRTAMADVVSGPDYHTIGLGIDIPELAAPSTGLAERLNVTFIGGYRHPPNGFAALRLMGSIMPRVRERHPGMPLLIVGADPGPEIYSAATADDEVTGTVPETRDYIFGAGIIAIPIATGGGMRVKLLEAMAAGKAIVASRLAAAGLDVTDGEQLLLAESDEEFAAAIDRLLSDPIERTRLERESRRWAIENLSWDARVRDYERVYTSLRVASAS